jgi:hypothetical protein
MHESGGEHLQKTETRKAGVVGRAAVDIVHFR